MDHAGLGSSAPTVTSRVCSDPLRSTTTSAALSGVVKRAMAAHPGRLHALRGAGTIIAFDCATPAMRDALYATLRDNGVLVGVNGAQSIRFRPALTFGLAHVEEFAAVFERTLAALEAKEPKSHALGYHFTDLDSARLILGSIGIRAANVGQLGGGVSISLASPVDMGWGGDDFAETVGLALWGSKWYQVMLGVPWADLKQKIESKTVKGSWPAAQKEWGSWKKKLECVFVVRIPSEENRDPRRLVPGRDDVYILPKTDCVPDENGEYFFYPNENIVAASSSSRRTTGPAATR